jgi:hypothetical protein
MEILIAHMMEPRRLYGILFSWQINQYGAAMLSV